MVSSSTSSTQRCIRSSMAIQWEGYPAQTPSRCWCLWRLKVLTPSSYPGNVTLISPYINNIHPTRHKELYSVIPEILQHALPMFERVLSDLLRPLLSRRVTVSGGYESRARVTVDCCKTYSGDLVAMNDRMSLKGRTLQVIVRLANIILTPEWPEYPGGKWHVEGLLQLYCVQRVGTEFVKLQGLRNETIF